MKLWLSFFLSILCVNTFAQTKEVTGIVFDKDSKARVAKVSVLNATSGKSAYNNFKGEFNIVARPGDMLIFSKQDHYSDTVKIKDYTALAIYLKPNAIALREVTIRDSFINPQKRLANTQREFSKIYGPQYNSDLLSIGSGGVGFGIDALYNAFSKSGRNAEKLRGIIDAEYRQNIIDYRFNKAFVQGITHLEEPKLTDFMHKYRPGYYLVTSASDYDFIDYIRKNLKRYQRRPSAYDLAPLPQVKWEPDTK
ncbi:MULTISPECIES: hypothetical protein [unclassified Mucilaginibacter]|uniref:hypothetical protein n=1 Tax=unclassified Mucilaginibacter TaxID=2617802 RepID=UPI002AC9E59F|nr:MULTISPECIES: hypothetical protein [unclassified Mucilaginibacter]MEB0261701.1 hypothetical protein [Mucilaginibacter sp. 10I4]MEB0278351.1 hypothetical protein [Mucilaginibacter sp. 10B2]MEB0301028.1 hypothetical protein [Mucilaginibacter sp. 5C4]WPX23996.1 hypothetical protein RHM67_01730 [Mucilaginibacter sp. 5C4]